MYVFAPKHRLWVLVRTACFGGYTVLTCTDKLYMFLRARLGACKIDLSPTVILSYRSLKGDTSVVVLIVLCLGVQTFCAVCALCMFSYFSQV